MRDTRKEKMEVSMSIVRRCYTEKRPGFDVPAQALYRELHDGLGVKSLSALRILNRYDTEGIPETAYEDALITVFSEPQCDFVYEETLPKLADGCRILAVEPLPGQFDQRADSCEQCIQLRTGGNRPRVAAAVLYIMEGDLSDSDMNLIRKHLINPVECREASLEKPDTLARMYPVPDPVPVLKGFCAADEAELRSLHERYALAMDLDDLLFFQAHFQKWSGATPRSRSFAWWTPTGAITAAIPPSGRTSIRLRSRTRR
jgi:phosphoribosylformylglycinamidine synthase